MGQCFDSGSYTFTITDAYGDGICCTYGNGGYSVKVDDNEVVSGGNFDISETKPFNVGSSAPVSPPTTPPPSGSSLFPSTAAPVSPPTSPTPGAPTMYPTQTAPTMYPTHSVPTMYPTAAADPVPTPYPTDVPPTPFPPSQTCASKGEPCKKHNDCCKE